MGYPPGCCAQPGMAVLAIVGALGLPIGMAQPAPPKVTDPIPGVPVNAKPLRIGLYVLLALTAVAALFLQPALGGAVERGALARFWLFLPIALYGAFLLAYAVDRALLVKRRRYPAGKAFFQIAFGVLFALLLLPSTTADFAARRPEGVQRYLVHSDAHARVLAIEALGFRGAEAARPYAKVLVDRLDDRDEEVRRAATAVLARWSGKKADDATGIRAWALEWSRQESP